MAIFTNKALASIILRLTTRGCSFVSDAHFSSAARDLADARERCAEGEKMAAIVNNEFDRRVFSLLSQDIDSICD